MQPGELDLSSSGQGTGAEASGRIYMDHAATSWPKNPAAVRAAFEYLQDCGATAGRGSYASARHADQWIARGRAAIAELIQADASSEIAFASSGTHALNAVLCGLLRKGQHVITTALEHNSVLRPLHRLSEERGFDYRVLPVGADGLADPQAVRQAVCDRSRYLIIGHASNVTGAVHDLQEWAQVAQQHGLELIVDASQTIGYLPVDVQHEAIAALASAGHKGLRALPGSGFVYVAQNRTVDFQPQMLGGTGRSSESMTQDPEWPDAIEVGNLNLPAIISMAVAANDLNLQSREEFESSWQPVFQKLLTGLREIVGVEIIGVSNSNVLVGRRIPVVSIAVDGWDPHDFATVLDSEFGIETRAGLHCAALIHEHLGTSVSSGTLRFSTGRSTSETEVEKVLDAIRTIVAPEDA